MTEFKENMTCEEFQAQLAELIGSGENISQHPHLQDCALCSAFLAELEAIAEAARQLFPVEEPPEEVWEHIEMAIQQEEESFDKG
jgi:hypothetical protein